MTGTKDERKERAFVTVGEASKLTGIEAQTIRKMADNLSLACYKTPSGQRRISLQSIQGLLRNSDPRKEERDLQRKNFVYARVSTRKQVDDLSRQLEFLRRPEYSSHTVVTDIASGINYKRKGLATILDACLQGNVGEVVVAHRDRLCRFGFELVEQLVTKAGGRITVLQDCDDKTSEQELAEDLLSILHVFSCRQMGKRSYAGRRPKNGKDKALPDREPEEKA